MSAVHEVGFRVLFSMACTHHHILNPSGNRVNIYKLEHPYSIKIGMSNLRPHKNDEVRFIISLDVLRYLMEIKLHQIWNSRYWMCL